MKAARILVVDDEEEVLRLLARRLMRLGYCVSSASTSSQALAHLQAAAFDVAIVDFMMPGMNGLELAGRCRSLHPGVKILMLTGSPIIAVVEAAGYPYVRKPLENLQELDLAIRRLLAVGGAGTDVICEGG